MNTCGGMVWWKAVSKTATCGSPGKMVSQAVMPARLGGLCRGAMAMHSSMAARTPGVTRAEFENFSPPWTTRWPTASTWILSLKQPVLGVQERVLHRGHGLGVVLGHHLQHQLVGRLVRLVGELGLLAPDLLDHALGQQSAGASAEPRS